MPNYQASSRPPAVTTADGTPIERIEHGATVTTLDQHRCYVADDSAIELAGVTYKAGDAILLTQAQATELRHAGALLPHGQFPKPATPMHRVGRVTEPSEGDVMTNRHNAEGRTYGGD